MEASAGSLGLDLDSYLDLRLADGKVRLGNFPSRAQPVQSPACGPRDACVDPLRSARTRGNLSENKSSKYSDPLTFTSAPSTLTRFDQSRCSNFLPPFSLPIERMICSVHDYRLASVRLGKHIMRCAHTRASRQPKARIVLFESPLIEKAERRAHQGKRNLSRWRMSDMRRPGPFTIRQSMRRISCVSLGTHWSVCLH